MDDKGVTSTFKKGFCYLTDRRDGVTFARIKKRNTDGLYAISVECRSGETVVDNKSTTKKMNAVPKRKEGTVLDASLCKLWHNRMGHPGAKTINRMIRSEKYGMNFSDAEKTQDCLSCTNAKQTRNRYDGKLVTKERTITIHADTCGPMQTLSFGGNRYFLALTAGEHKYVRVHFMKKRDEVVEYFENYVNWLERHSGKKVGRIHTDNAPEFVKMRKAFERKGITLTTSSPYSPQSNGLAERMNRILAEKARAMLDHSGLCKKYWVEAVRQAADLHNRTATPELNNKTPMEVLLGTIPNNAKLRTFGCAAYVHKHKETRKDKFDKRVEEGMYLGNQHGLFRMWLPKKNRVVTTKHATFDERKFPLSETTKNAEIVQEEKDKDIPEQRVNNKEPTIVTFDDDDDNEITDASEQRSDTSEVINVEGDVQQEQALKNNNVNTQLRRSTRVRKEPQRFKVNAIPRTFTSDEPTLQQAIKSADKEEWVKAITKEIKTLKAMECWEQVSRPVNERVLHTKFVLKRKRDENNEISKYKARLVVCGNEEVESHEETFSPVAHYSVIKLIFCLCIQRNWTVKHIDFENAFPNGESERPVYVEMPSRMPTEQMQNKAVFRLRKSLYGLRDAARIWSKLLFQTLESCGLKEMETEPCVFVGDKVIIICYVDDLLIFAENQDIVDNLYRTLEKQFRVKDLGRPTRFLGLNITYNSDRRISFSQEQLVNKLLEETGMDGSKPVGSPIDEWTFTKTIESEPLDVDEHAKYRSIIGSLMYIANRTRPDLLVATSMLASYLHAPTKVHMAGVKRTLRYLNGTKERQLVLRPGHDDQLTAYVDSSWGNAFEKGRRSRSGMIVKFGHAVIGAVANLQNCVSLSSTEAEYVALTEAVKTVIWLNNVLKELGVPQNPPQIFQDNVGCMEWVHGGTAKHFNKRKHIDLKHHYLMSIVESKKVVLKLIGTREMEADFLTKPLYPTELRRASEIMNIFN